MEYITNPVTETELAQLTKGSTPVLVDFFATWCEPCNYLDEILQELESRLGDKIRIFKLDVDQQPEVSKSLRIMSVPTLMIYKDGEFKWRMAGFKLAHELEEDLKQYIETK